MSQNQNSETMLYIALGDSVDYINQAIEKEDAILIESYEDDWKTRVESCDKIRNIYTETEWEKARKVLFACVLAIVLYGLHQMKL